MFFLHIYFTEIRGYEDGASWEMQKEVMGIFLEIFSFA